MTQLETVRKRNCWNIKQVLKETKYKAGYIRRVELIDGEEFGGKDTKMISYYNLDGYYIGSREENKALPIGFKTKTLDDCKKMAIAFAESVS